MMKRISSYRLAIILVMILIPSFIAVGLLNYYVQRDSIREELITTSLPLVRDLIDWEINTRLQDPILASSLMARDTFLIDWIQDGETDPAKVEKYLEAIRLEHGFATAFFVSAKTSLYYTYQGIHKEVSTSDAHDIWYYDFIASGDRMELDVDSDEVSAGRLTVFINYRVESSDGELLGVVGVGLDMSDIAELLRQTQSTFGRVVYMVDESGLVQAHSDMEFIENRNINTTSGIERIADEILASRTRTLDTHYEGSTGNILLTSRYIPDIRWYIIVEQDENVSLQLVRMMLFKTILIGLFVSILSLIISIRVVYLYNQRLEQASRLDHLTQVSNRLEIDQRIISHLAACQHNGGTFSVMMIDIDNFKVINDTFGHIAGDDTLIQFARLVSSSIRAQDSLGRWGGDEFLLILPSMKGDEAVMKANQIRSLVSEQEDFSSHRVTLSIGVAEYHEDDTIESLLARTDRALYKAKKAGKNQTVLEV